MPTRPARLCGCGAVHAAGDRCPDARPAWTRADGTSYHDRGDSARRRRAARDRLFAETPLCRCGAVATERDHRWPIEYGGDRWDLDNEQALCTPCHRRKTRRERDGPGRPVVSVTPYTVVCGPPLAGKTTYVTAHAQRGDLILDLDDLAAAMLIGRPRGPHRDAIHPFIVEARDAALDRLARPSRLRHAWVVTGAPRRRDRARFRGAEIVLLATPADECRRRADQLKRPAATREWIAAWWAAYEPD